jgi:peptidoglycan/LPS O-acetylase OafA/YrhL
LNPDTDQDAKITRRIDIQGLRGLAVLSVVAYHSGLPIHGGFLGVDVFFAISGYVISQAIFNDATSSGGFKLRAFFARRINRLIPLLTLVNIFIMVFAVLLLSPFGGIQQVTSALRASTLFYANAHFFLTNNYLDLVANPVRHLWSLSVEEQFYFVYPIVIAVFLRLNNGYGQLKTKKFTLIMICSALASVCACLFLTRQGAPNMDSRFAFFGTPFRAWEFLAGVLAYQIQFQLKLNDKYRWAIEAVGCMAFAALGISFLVTDLSNNFPNRFTIIPVISTSVLLLLGNRTRAVKLVLASPPLVWIGDRSYGWYLWHWPIIAFASSIISNSIEVKLFSSFVALLFSAFTYQLIEERFRGNRSFWHSIRLFLICGCTVFILSFIVDTAAGTGLGIPLNGPGPSSLGACYVNQKDEMNLQIENVCSNDVPDGPLVLIVGDSQAHSAADGLFEAGRLLGVRVMGYGAGGCPMRSQSMLRFSSWCPGVQDRYLKAIDKWQPDLVIFANRYDDYAFYGGESGSDVRIPFADGRLPEGTNEQMESIVESLFVSVSAVRSRGSQVAILGETPNVLLPPNSLFGKYFEVRSAEVADIAKYNELRALILELIEERIVNSGTIVLDPQELLCQSTYVCGSVIDGELAYSNPQHLNRIGSLKLIPLWTSLLSKLEIDK